MISLHKGLIPASAGFSDADPELPANPAASIGKIDGRWALSESLAFGGHNSVIILEADHG
jgi:3-oxoacyl-[acyl-carrier-protein] synthase-1/3-oxoacyl-[acyl-carrier-protein] synthase II